MHNLEEFGLDDCTNYSQLIDISMINHAAAQCSAYVSSSSNLVLAVATNYFEFSTANTSPNSN